MRTAAASCAPILLAAFVLACTSGCAGARAERDPGTLVVLENGDTTMIYPLFSNDTLSAIYQTLVLDGLVGIGDDFKPTPLLATSWTPSDGGRLWTIELRRGVRWSDGAPFSSKDVAFTWKTMLDPATGFFYRGQFDYVKSVRAEGPNRVIFRLAHPNPLFVLVGLNWWILPEHVLGKVPPKQLVQNGFGEHPIGTGAYVLAEWRHDERLRFEANPYWWGGKPRISHLLFQVVLNPQAAIEAMEEGTADVVDNLGPSSYAIFKSDRANVRLLRIPDLFLAYIQINLTTPGLNDVNVRRAMMYGWDRADVDRGLYQGDLDMATSITPTGLREWYDPHVPLYPFDPARARALLDKAGYLPGPDGIRRKGNVRLAYTLSVAGNGGAAQDFVAEFEFDMQQIGIAIALRTVDFATFLEEMDDMRYQLASTEWGGTPDPDQETLLGSDQFPPNGNNEMHYVSARADRDLRGGLATLDFARRKALYDDLQRVFAEDVPLLYYAYPFYEVAIGPRVRFDFAKTLPGIYLFRDVTQWELVR